MLRTRLVSPWNTTDTTRSQDVLPLYLSYGKDFPVPAPSLSGRNFLQVDGFFGFLDATDLLIANYASTSPNGYRHHTNRLLFSSFERTKILDRMLS